MHKNYLKNTPKSKLIGLSLLGLLVVVVSVVAWQKRYINKPSTTGPVSNSDSSQINYNPPSEQEKKETTEHKAKLGQEPITPPSLAAKVNPIITGANRQDDYYIVGAFIPGVFESGGTCTLTATLGNSVITKTSSAEKENTTTRCTNFSINQSEFISSGDWTLKVKYSSPNASGTSETFNLKINL